MKVFISWSGKNEASHVVAQALYEWLPSVLQAVDPWLSSESQDAGTRWSANIAGELERTDFGIICVTQASMASPWLNFEAGALSKRVESACVVPFLIDLDTGDLVGPLTQFMAVRADEQGTLSLLKTMNKAIKGPLPEPRLEGVFEKFWPDLQKAMTKPAAAVAPVAKRDTHEIVTEILEIVRALPRTSPDPDEFSTAVLRSLRMPSRSRTGLDADALKADALLKPRSDDRPGPPEKPQGPGDSTPPASE